MTTYVTYRPKPTKKDYFNKIAYLRHFPKVRITCLTVTPPPSYNFKKFIVIIQNLDFLLKLTTRLDLVSNNKTKKKKKRKKG
jgi:hypothetical protein